MTMTAVSLFAGVEGIGLALSRAGVNVVAAVEIDKAARGVIADRFPETTLFDDVTKVTGEQLLAAGFVPERGILGGGFPCQDLSVAGRRRGMGEGTRSGLFWHIDRLMAELRPAWVLLENVPGLLSSTCPCPGDGLCVDNGRQPRCGHNVKGTWVDDEFHGVKDGACEGGCVPAHGGAMGAVVGSLGKRGYGFAWRVLDAQHFGVPQRRRRVFIVGHLGDDSGPVQILLEPEVSGGHSAPGLPPGAGITRTPSGGTATSSGGGQLMPTLLARYGKGTSSDADDPLVVSTLQGGGVAATGSTPSQRRADTSSRSVVMALTSSGVGTCGPDDNQAQAGHLIATSPPPLTYQKVIRSGARDVNGDLPAEVWAERDIAATLNLNDLGSESRSVELVVAPILGFSHSAGIDNQVSEDVYPTVKAGRDGMPATATATAVRRLTPLECERLQGFPDGWTLTSDGKPQADAARYRQMGNAVAVPVVEWIAHRLVAVNDRKADA